MSQKKKTIIVKLQANKSFYFYTTKIKRKQVLNKKLSLKKYDPFLRRKLLFVEMKIK